MKQFKLSSETVLQYQIMYNDNDLNESEVVDLLNKLADDFKLLLRRCEKLSARIKQLEKDNEHQHEEIINSHIAYVECLNQIKELKEERDYFERKKCDNNE